jgi:hypothetical protein
MLGADRDNRKRKGETMSEVADTTKLLVREYKDFTIELETRGYSAWNFIVSDEDFHGSDDYGNRSFPSLKAAMEAIDKQLADDVKVSIMALSEVREPVLDETGRAMTITGLHRGTSAALVEGSKPYNGYVYPMLPWVADALHRQIEIREELEKLRSKLHKVHVRIGVGYGRKIAVEYYASRVKQLQKEIQAARKLAESMK